MERINESIGEREKQLIVASFVTSSNVVDAVNEVDARLDSEWLVDDVLPTFRWWTPVPLLFRGPSQEGQSSSPSFTGRRVEWFGLVFVRVCLVEFSTHTIYHSQQAGRAR